MAETSHDLAATRKRLRFRCWHRGSREADLLLGRFADAHVQSMDADGLAALEALLARDDPDIWDWVAGRAPVPPAYDTEVMALLRASANMTDGE